MSSIHFESESSSSGRQLCTVMVRYATVTYQIPTPQYRTHSSTYLTAYTPFQCTYQATEFILSHPKTTQEIQWGVFFLKQCNVEERINRRHLITI